MKREILFRGKSIYTKVLVYGYLTSKNCIEEVEIIPETIGQFTGLTDKNGVKIFEGDILKGGIYSRYVVEWDSYNCEFNIHAFNVDLFEIIGNIHDND